MAAHSGTDSNRPSAELAPHTRQGRNSDRACGTRSPLGLAETLEDHDLLSNRIKELSLENSGQATSAPAPTSRPNTADALRRGRRRSSVDSWGNSTARRRDSRMPSNSQATWRIQRARERWRHVIERIMSFARWNRFEVKVKLPADLMHFASGGHRGSSDMRAAKRIEMREFRVGAGVPTSIAEALRKPAKERDANEVDSLAIFASTLRGLQGIPERCRTLLLGLGRFESVGAGRVVTQEGREPETVLLILSGKVAEFSEENLPFVMRTYGKGDWFGECSSDTRSTSTLTIEHTELLAFPIAGYRHIMNGTGSQVHLPSLPLFSTLTMHKEDLAVNFRLVVCPVDEILLRQDNSSPSHVHIIVDGSVAITKELPNSKESLLLGRLRKGHAFGLFSRSPTAIWAEIAHGASNAPFTVTTSERSTFLLIPKETFAQITTESTWQYLALPDPEETMQRAAENANWQEYITEHHIACT